MALAHTNELDDRINNLAATLAAGPSQGPWAVRSHPTLASFVTGPKTAAMPYALEVLCEDYEGFGGDEQRARDVAFVAACSPEVIAELLRRAGISAT